MVVLGLAVGKGPTALDDSFRSFVHANVHDRRLLLVVVDWRLLVAVVAASAVAALWRRQWLLVALVVLAPPAAIFLSRALKLLFDRNFGGGLAYPSGHVTALTVVAGMAVLAAGGRRWALAVAAVAVAIGMVAVGSTFHYVTDTVGAVFFGTAAVCACAVIADTS